MYIRWNYINEKMTQKGISNNKMAKELGINIATWSNYKAEKRDITLKVFCKVLEILELNFDNIVRDTKLSDFTASNDTYITDSSRLRKNIEKLINETENKTRTIKFKMIEKD